MSRIFFTCSMLNGTGKAGKLPRDADGYVTMPIGALNIFNSIGQYYGYDEAKELFETSGSLMRRIANGDLKGECGHPKPLEGQSMESFAQRVQIIEEKSIASHKKSVWLDFDKVSDELGRPVVAIMAKVRGSGPYGPALDASLDNPGENTNFSIRAFTEDTRLGGVTQRALRQIITWDWVTEPGISVARKYKSPALEGHHGFQAALESRTEVVFTREDLERSFQLPGYAQESVAMNTRELFTILGWRYQGTMPSFMAW